MGKKISAVMAFIIIAAALTGCINSKELEFYKKAVEGLNGQLVMKENEIMEKKAELMDSIEDINDKYYEKKLIELLGAKKVEAMAKEQWTYKLTVNGYPFTGDNIIISNREVVITLSQTEAEKVVLPKSIHQSGVLRGKGENKSFHDHLTLESKTAYDRAVSGGTRNERITYTLKEVPSESVIMLKLSEDLKERLKLPAASLKIIVR